MFLGTVTALRGSDVTEDTLDLLIVKENGEIQCLDGEDLQEKWTSPASALQRESTAPTSNSTVEFVHLTNAHAASQVILRGRQDFFTLFPQEISEDGFNPDILFIVTKSIESRNIHIVTLPRRSTSHSIGSRHSVDSLLSVNLPPLKGHGLSRKATFSLQVSSGTLQQLHNGRLTTFDLSNTLPKEISQIRSKDANSFLRLSTTSIIVSSNTSLHVYNPKFQSILASTQLDGKPNTETLKRKRGETGETNGATYHDCNLVSYFPKLGVAVGILDNNLVGIQIESLGKGRASGLLIDSLGCSIPGQTRPGRVENIKEIELTTLDSYLPGEVFDAEDPWDEQIKPLEEAFKNGNATEFDALMAERFGHLKGRQPPTEWLVNGTNTPEKTDTPQLPADVDRRWVMYVLGKIFTWSQDDNASVYRLSVPFYPPSTFAWLLRNGYTTVSNIESALKGQIRKSPVDALPRGELVGVLVEMDRDMDLLYALLAKNFLNAAELLSAIRHLMDSLELMGERSQAKQILLTNGGDTNLANGGAESDVEEQVTKLEAEAEADLALAEYQLGPGSGVRSESLSLALSKLYTCPTGSIVHALQTTFSTQEVVALIYLLRFELARGAWTTRYMDAEQSEIIDEDGDIQDNSIVLISSLLNNCVDAIGAGGWLSGDARLVNGDPFEAEELIASLKLEVSAALEGIQEAVYLRGITSEMIRYGDAVQGGVPTESSTPGPMRRRMPVLLPSAEQDLTTLPLGLKANQQIGLLKVGAGGEIHERTMRDIGHLKSQKVGKYSLERIIV